MDRLPQVEHELESLSILLNCTHQYLTAPATPELSEGGGYMI